VAGLLGLAVGIEREWSGHASGPGARFAGARTFLLLGVLGGVAGLLLDRGNELAGATLLAGAAALAVSAYVVAARRGGEEAVDGTTEAAALAVLGLAVQAGLGALRLAAATGAVLVLALREKSAIQGFVRRIGEVELRAGLQFAVLALVLLPILPVGPYGPFGGIRPRELWGVVLLVSGLNFLGYLARRIVGASRGDVVAGLAGGLVSSTAVSLTFARQSREPGADGPALALGVIGACTTIFPRLFVLTLALQPALTWRVFPIFLPALTAGAAMIVIGLRRPQAGTPAGTSKPGDQSPLRLGSAVVLALGFQAALLFMGYVRHRYGNPGVLGSSAFLGLTDMDALTLSLTRLAADADRVSLAALGMLVGLLANTALKLGVVLVVGTGGFRRRAATGLGTLAALLLLGLWLGRPY